jgi:hypothetical protein
MLYMVKPVIVKIFDYDNNLIEMTVSAASCTPQQAAGGIRPEANKFMKKAIQ